MNTQNIVLAVLFHFRELYRVTEGLQREKQSLMKQLDLLRFNNQTWVRVWFNLFLTSGSIPIGIPHKSGWKLSFMLRALFSTKDCFY